MSYLVVMILDNPDHLEGVVEAWQEIGVTGATIMETTGMGRMMQQGMRDDLPLMPRLEDFLGVREEPHRTIFSVVKTEEIIEQMVAAAEKIIGRFEDPHTGVLFVLPVLKTYGFKRMANRGNT